MYIPDIRPNMQLYQPNNWNPTTMPLCEISLPTFNDINPNVGFSNQGGMMTVQTQAVNMDQGGMTMTSQTQPIKVEQGGMMMTSQTQAFTG